MAMIDTNFPIETPEGVHLTLYPAGPLVRACAWLTDFAIRCAIYFILAFLPAVFGTAGTGLLLISIFLLEWFYPVFFEVYKYGQTPGKRAMNLRVVQADGTPVTWQASILRNLMRTADFLPLFYGFGLCAMLMSRHFQRLGDLVAGTLVVHGEKAVTQQVSLPRVKPKPPAYPLELAEQRSIVGFAERAPRLPEERARELAAILKPLIRSPSRENVQTVYRIAAWLTGYRS